MDKVLRNCLRFDKLQILVELDVMLVEDLRFEEDVRQVAVQPADHQRLQLFFAYLLKFDLLLIIVLLIDLDLQSVKLVDKLLLKSQQLTDLAPNLPSLVLLLHSLVHLGKGIASDALAIVAFR